MSDKDPKTKLRKEILKQRQNLSPSEWQIRSNLVCERLQNLALFNQAKIVFAYFSFRQEVDLSSLFSLNKKWAFPRCIEKSLVWHSWCPEDPTVTDKYGIQTPAETAPILSFSTADLILVPTVACDRQGYRLGYGGGYYDRLLSLSQGSHIPTIGVVFDFAYVSQLPIDDWDIKLDFICTETQFN